VSNTAHCTPYALKIAQTANDEEEKAAADEASSRYKVHAMILENIFQRRRVERC